MGIKLKRKKWMRVIAILLVFCIGLNITIFGLEDISLQSEPDADGQYTFAATPSDGTYDSTLKQIVGFEPLPATIQNQAVLPGTSQAELVLPDKLTAHISGREIVEIPVASWSCVPHYDPDTEGLYEFSPEFDLTGYHLPDTLDLPIATVQVTTLLSDTSVDMGDKNMLLSGTSVDVDYENQAIYANGQRIIIDTDSKLFYRGDDLNLENPLLFRDIAGNSTTTNPPDSLFRYNIYGGFKSGNSLSGPFNTNITIIGSQRLRSVYGGNENGSFTGTTTINVKGGEIDYAIYGGNREGDFTGSSYITINGDFALGHSNDLDFRGVYGGNRRGDFSGSTNIEIKKGEFAAHEIAGGNKEGDFYGMTDIVLSGTNAGDIALSVPVFGGNIDGVFNGVTNILAENYVTSGASIYGGNRAGTFLGTAAEGDYASRIELYGHVIMNGPVYGANRSGLFTGDTFLRAENVTDNAITLYGGGSSGGDVIGNTLVYLVNSQGHEIFGGSSGGSILDDGSGNKGNTAVYIDGGFNNRETGGIPSVSGGGINGRAANGVPRQIAGTANVYIDKRFGIADHPSKINKITGSFLDADEQTVANKANIEIYDGVITHVYGNNSYGAGLTKEVSILIDGANAQIGSVYGGGRQFGTVTSADIRLKAGKIDNLFGGGDAQTIAETTNITVESGEVGTIYGGGGNLTAAENTNIRIESGDIGSIYGGGGYYSSTTGTSNITVESGNIDYLFGGGYYSTATGTTNVTVDNGNIFTLYGGGDSSAVTGTTNVTVKSGRIETLIGGGYSAAAETANIRMENGSVGMILSSDYSDVRQFNMELLGGTVDTVCGGSYNYNGGSPVRTDRVSMKLDGVTVTGQVFGGGYYGTEDNPSSVKTVSITVGETTPTNIKNNFHGGGYYYAPVESAHITLGEHTWIEGDLFGGSATREGIEMKNVLLDINGGTYEHNILGGGLTPVANTTINYNSGLVKGWLFGGGRNSSSGQVTLNISGGTLAENIYLGSLVDEDTIRTDVDQAVLNFTGGTALKEIYLGGRTHDPNHTNSATTVAEAVIDINGGTLAGNKIYSYGEAQGRDTVTAAAIKVHKLAAVDYHFYFDWDDVARSEVVIEQLDEVAKYLVIAESDPAYQHTFLKPYKLDTPSCLVIYDGNGASQGVPASPVTVKSGTRYTIADARPTRSNYRFTGWYYADTDTIYEAGDSFTMPMQDVTLTAQWQYLGGNGGSNPINPPRPIRPDQPTTGSTETTSPTTAAPADEDTTAADPTQPSEAGTVIRQDDKDYIITPGGEDNLFLVSDTDGSPVGYVQVPPGKSIEDINIGAELQPLATVPKTGDRSYLSLLIILGISAAVFGGYLFLEKRRNAIK